MIKVVEKLERVFFLNFLRQWLSLDEVAKLDTAFTSALQRQPFLELLSKSNCKHSNDGDYQFTSCLLIDWMTRRNILFDALTVSSDTLNSSTIGIFGSETLTSFSCSHFWQQEQKIGDPEVVSQVNRIFSTIPNLSEIKLTNSKFVTGLDVTINCPHLTSCDFTFLTKLTDNFVVNLSQKCPQLTRVVLSQCKLLTDTSTVSLVKSCKALSFLHVGGCKKLTAVTFQSIASECSQLTGFNMDYCTKTQKIGDFGRFGAPPAAGDFGFGGGFGLFGAAAPASTPAATIPSGGFGFGAPSSSAGGFGAPSSTAGGFGAPSSTAGGFGAPSSTAGGFGAPSSSAGGFGASSSTAGGFGASSSTAGGFGAPSSTAGGFGASCSTAGGFGFGAAAVPPPAAVPASGFGFGSSNATFGAMPAAVSRCEKSHEELIIDIVRSNPLLTELYVRDSDITDNLLLAIAECLPDIKVLDFSGCGQVTDDGLVPLAESCKLLSELIWEPPQYDVNEVTQRTFLVIAAHCPEFKRFRLPEQLITKAVLSEVSMDIGCVDLCAAILDCSQFRATGRSVTKDRVKNKDFNLLAPYCTGAHTYRCESQTLGYEQKPGDHVLFLQQMPDVKHLDLICHDGELTDTQLIALSKHLTKLESAVLKSSSYEVQFSNNALLSLTKNNPFLTKLDIGYCEELDDAALATISEHCRGLKWLNIYFASKITDEGFLSLANNCRRLQYLDASGCIALTDVGILSVIARCKELQTFLFNTYKRPSFDKQVAERYEMHFKVNRWSLED